MSKWQYICSSKRQCSFVCKSIRWHQSSVYLNGGQTTSGYAYYTDKRLEEHINVWSPLGRHVVVCCSLAFILRGTWYGSVHLHNFAVRNIRGEGQHLAKFRIPMIHRFMTSHPRCKVAALLWREAARWTPDTIWFFQYYHPHANGILYLEYWGCREDKWSAFQANIMAKQNDEYHAAIRNIMASLSLFQNKWFSEVINQTSLSWVEWNGKNADGHSFKC